MQSGAVLDYSQAASIPPSPTALPSSRQHGSSSSVFGSADFYSPHHGEEVGASGTSGNGSGPGEAVVDIMRVEPSTPNRSSVSTPLSKANRIAQYEAMAGSPSYGGGPDAGFIVSKTDWSGKAPGDSSIARFPNELLIHTLSFLEPSSLLVASLISKRFHALVNSSHAWRAAFVRYFPPPFAQVDDHGSPLPSQDKRFFTRLSTCEIGENAWRKEYMQRTRLLRSLSKGKVQVPSFTTNKFTGGLMVTYPARTGSSSVSHMTATFALNSVRCVHSSLETQFVTASDPTAGKIEKRPPRNSPVGWRSSTPDLRQVRNDHPDYAVAVDMNVNRVMDISEELGWIMGENMPDGVCYVHPYPNPYISTAAAIFSFIGPGTNSEYGLKPLVTCVWIAKKRNGGVCETTGAAVIVGNSRGFVRMFSILRGGGGVNHLYQIQSFCLCPGVPVVQIKVDEDYLPRRLKQNRPWVAVINALGEVYYLRKPLLGSTVKDWQMIPQTARVPMDLYYEVFPDLPDTVSGECLKQNVAERTALLLKMDYYKIRELWQGCRMDWIVEVDWAGENIITGRTGSESYWHGMLVERADVPLRRYHPRERESAVSGSFVAGVARQPADIPSKESLFGDDPGVYTSSADLPEEGRLSDLGDEWLCTELRLDRESFSRITACCLDNSILARFVAGEDPSLRDGLPGDNGRLFAVGTNTGSVFVFNIRPTSQPEPVELPIRSIHTESPQISTLAVSSLVVVHGGDDGLVQAWDPLGSAAAPIRTIHSKFSARARRRIEQNAGAAVSDNQFAARCLVLDSDPTNLRGVVALGTFIRYWSFSGHTGTNLKKKRKIGAGRRGNATPGRVKIQLKADIRSDEIALRKEQERQRKEAEELEKRYGIASGRTALSEEEMLAYARMISQETYEMESSSRSEVASSLSGRSADAATPDGSVQGLGGNNRAAANPEDVDLERALRLSLQDVEVNEMCDQGNDIWEHASELLAMEPGPSRYTLDPFSLSPSPATSSTSSPQRNAPKMAGREKVPLEDWPSIGSDRGKWKQPSLPVEQAFEDDLELAMRLSLQEYEGSGVKGKGVA